MKVIIFDMDGTLINSEKKYYDVWDQLLTEKNYKLSEDFYQTILGSPTTEIEKAFLHYYGDEFPFHSLFSSFMTKREELILAAEFDLIPGVMPLLSWALANNIRCGLATSSAKNNAEHLLTQLGIMPYLSFQVYGDDLKHGKPDPEIFNTAISLSQAKKERIVVFEDSKNGILSADAAGLTVFHINDFIPLESDIAKIPLASYKDFNDALHSDQFLNFFK